MVNALRPFGSVIAEHDPRLRHTSYRQYRATVVPWLQACLDESVRDYRVFALFREPTEWLSSWFRFRRMQAAADSGDPGTRLPSSITWPQFLECCCARPRPAFAQVGSQADFVRSESGEVGPTDLFAFDQLTELIDALSEQVGRRISLPQFNVSPAADFEITDQHYRYCRDRLSEEYDLYDSL